jgi:thiol-disulfide isomerase/thioredoxin
MAEPLHEDKEPTGPQPDKANQGPEARADVTPLDSQSHLAKSQKNSAPSESWFTKPYVWLIAVIVAIAAGFGAYSFMYNSSGLNTLAELKDKNTPKGPLKAYATGALAGLMTYAQPKPTSDIGFFDRDQKPVRLSSFNGKVVVLNLWATWCAPCRTEMPTLANLQTRYQGQDVKVLALSVDTQGDFPKAKSFMDVHTPLDLYVDPNFAAPSSLGVKNMPTTLILDRQGREVARLEGEASWDSPETKALLDKLLSR